MTASICRPLMHNIISKCVIIICVIGIPLRNCTEKTIYGITFACRFFHGKQVTAYEQIRVHAMVVDCFIDPGLCRIHCCMVLHYSEVIVSDRNESCIVVCPTQENTLMQHMFPVCGFT